MRVEDELRSDIHFHDTWIISYQPFGGTWTVNDMGYFSTAIQMWQFLNHIPPPSIAMTTTDGSRVAFKPPVGAIRAYIVYRKSIKTAESDGLTWNSPKIRYMVQYTLRNHGDQELDAKWEHVLLSTVGECIGESVVGLRLLDRSKKKSKKKAPAEETPSVTVEHRIEIWCSEKTPNILSFVQGQSAEYVEKEK